MAPAAMALFHGLRGADDRRTEWLRVLHALRGSRHSGYDVVFDALLLLDRDDAEAAHEVLTGWSGPREVFLDLLFVQWTASLAAEASVLAGRPGAGEHVAAHSTWRVPGKRSMVLVRGDRDRASLAGGIR